MTVTFELEDEETAQLLQVLFGYGLVCRLDGFKDEASETHDLFVEIYDQADGQIGGDDEEGDD